MAAEVVAVVGGADHHPHVVEDGTGEIRRGELPLATAYGVPHDEAHGVVTVIDSNRVSQEDEAVAGVEHVEVAAVGEERGEGGGGGGRGREPRHDGVVVLEESEQGRGPVDLAVVAAELGAGEEAAPRGADERGAEETPGVVRREAGEDVHEEVVAQLRRRRTLWRHGGGGILRSGGEMWGVGMGG